MGNGPGYPRAHYSGYHSRWRDVVAIANAAADSATDEKKPAAIAAGSLLVRSGFGPELTTSSVQSHCRNRVAVPLEETTMVS